MKYVKRYILLREDIDGVFHIHHPRLIIGTITNVDNLEDMLAMIYITRGTHIYGYKTMSGARRKILGLIAKK